MLTSAQQWKHLISWVQVLLAWGDCIVSHIFFPTRHEAFIAPVYSYPYFAFEPFAVLFFFLVAARYCEIFNSHDGISGTKTFVRFFLQ